MFYNLLVQNKVGNKEPVLHSLLYCTVYKSKYIKLFWIKYVLHNIQCYNENSVLFCIYCMIYIYFSIFLTVSFHSILTRDEQDFTISVSGSSCSYPFYALCSLLFSLFLFLDIPWRCQCKEEIMIITWKAVRNCKIRDYETVYTLQYSFV